MSAGLLSRAPMRYTAPSAVARWTVAVEEVSAMKRDLKLEDLKERSEIVPMKLLSVRVPVDLIQRIDDVVDLLNAGKGEVVVALLNEGLGRYDKAKGGVRKRLKGKK
jgi:hypothetical protein